MIISASYRTDIPALFGPWFAKRFRAGCVVVASPYGAEPIRVELRDGVDGFVFWTRNAAPFLDALDEVRRAGFPFVVQFTVTGLPRRWEAAVPATEAGLAGIREVANRFGPSAAVWRFDPIVIAADLTPADTVDRFARLADALTGSVDEVVASFVQPYRKARAAMGKAGGWTDPTDQAKRALAGELARLAAERGMRFGLCSQPDLLPPGVTGSACIDAGRLTRVAQSWGLTKIVAAPVKGNRPGCLCHQSRDIGAYDTCAQGCAYCYAVRSRAAAKRRLADHDPEAESLI